MAIHPMLTSRMIARAVLLSAVAAVIAAVVAAGDAPPAYAHAALVRSNPANNESLIRPPIRVTLFFSEGLERKLTKIEVVDQQNERVDDGDLRFDDADPTFASVGLPDLVPGAYFVRWSNVSSVDGHPYSGQYPFIILNEDGSLPAGVDPANLGGATSGGTEALPKPVDSALKWIAMISLAAVAGAAFFVAAVLRPATAFLEDDDRQRTIEGAEQWLVNIAHVLLPASFIAAALLVVVAVNSFATSTSLWDYLTSVRTGEYRAALLALLIIALAGTDLLFLSRGRTARNAGIALLIFATAGSLFTYSMVSHGATDEGKFWSVLSDYAHLAASAVWLGMLVMLPPLLRTRTLGEGARRYLFQANVFDRFSVAAGLSVIVILATGVFNSLVEIPRWSAFTDTTYGRVLLVKLGLVALLLPVAGLNAFVLKPRLVRAIDEAYPEGSDSAASTVPAMLARLERMLPRTIVLEVVMVLAVFASVSILTQTSTAKGEIAQEEAQRQASAADTQTTETEGLQLALEVTPNLAGQRNQYNLRITTTDGSPVPEITQARLRFNYDAPDTVLPQQELVLTRFGEGDYRGEGPFFTQPGNWRVEVRIRRAGADDISRLFIFGVLEPARTNTDEGGTFDLPFDSLTWNETAGAALAILGAVLLLYRRELRGIAAAVERVSLSAAAVLLVGGAVLWFALPDEHGAGGDLQAGNPIKPTQSSVARGRELFQLNCVSCHGADGRGDGPSAAGLNPPPSDFRLHMPNHTDPEFFNFIANGYPGTAMPAFRQALSDEDIWNLVNFLRASFSEAPTE